MIRVEIRTTNPPFPSWHDKEEYVAEVKRILTQVEKSVENFAENAGDRTDPLFDANDQVCGECHVVKG